jgi:hypothetical protein
MQTFLKHIFEGWNKQDNFFQKLVRARGLENRLCEIAENKLRDALYLAMNIYKERNDGMNKNNNEYFNFPEILLYNILRF